MTKSKGQIFVVGVVLLVVILALFRESFVITPPSSPTIDDLIGNIEKEYRYAAGISHKNNQDSLEDLSRFFRKNVNGFEGLYLLIFTTDNDFEVFVGNYLRARVDASLDAVGTGSQGTTIRLDDDKSALLDFGVSGNVTLTLSYTKGGGTIKEIISFSTNQDSLVFYDITIKENDRLTRRKDVAFIRIA